MAMTLMIIFNPGPNGPSSPVLSSLMSDMQVVAACLLCFLCHRCFFCYCLFSLSPLFSLLPLFSFFFVQLSCSDPPLDASSAKGWRGSIPDQQILSESKAKNLYFQAMASMIEVYSRVRGAQGDNRFAITIKQCQQ